MAQNRKLFQLFERFSQSKDFAEEMTDLFLNISTHTISTFSENMTDGIGDYVSHVYFIEKFNDLFSDCENVSLKNISVLEEKKFPIGLIIRKDKINENSVCYLNENDSSETTQNKINNYQNIILNSDALIEGESNTILQKTLSESDFLFNIALSLNAFLPGYISKFGYKCRFSLTPDINPQCLTESWLEYSLGTSPHEFQQPFMYSQHCMGIYEDEMGIRFIDKLTNNNASLENLKNKKILNNICTDMPIETMMNENDFAIGYLQNIDASNGFAALASSITKKQCLNIFVNMNHFQMFYAEIKHNQTQDKQKYLTYLQNMPPRYLNFNYTSTLQKHLSEQGFTHVDFENETGFERVTIDNNNPLYYGKILRLCNFHNLSEHDKYIWYGVAEAVSASGDTSFSELCSTSIAKITLPFIPEYNTKEFGSHLITELNRLSNEIENKNRFSIFKTENNYPALIKYLSITIIEPQGKSNWLDEQNKNTYINFVKNNIEKILAGWKDYCTYLYLNRNEQKHFDELIVTYAFHHLIKHNKMEDCLRLIKLLNPDSFKNQNLLHLAVKLNNVDAVERILQEDIFNINQPRHGDLYTPLHIAVYNNNQEMIKLLLDYKADMNKKDFYSKSPNDYANKSDQISVSELFKWKKAANNDDDMWLDYSGLTYIKF